jgi:hypothetical protein
MRGSVIERSQHRQRKLDGILSWYFDCVVESLPLMLHGALLLFGCALFRYFWDSNTTVAPVVPGFRLIRGIYSRTMYFGILNTHPVYSSRHPLGVQMTLAVFINGKTAKRETIIR